MWFRLYTDVLHDPKVQSLPPHLFKLWINLLCIAAQNNGVLPDHNGLNAVLKGRLDHLANGINALSKAGLIDHHEGIMRPHNWEIRQYKSDTSTGRVKSYRDKIKRFGNVTGNVAGNVSETVPDNRITKEQITNTSSNSNSGIYNGNVNGINGEKGEGEKEPRHNAKSRSGFIYCRSGTMEFDAYAADYLAKWHEAPRVNKWGGRWFSLLGEK